MTCVCRDKHRILGAVILERVPTLTPPYRDYELEHENWQQEIRLKTCRPVIPWYIWKMVCTSHSLLLPLLFLYQYFQQEWEKLTEAAKRQKLTDSLMEKDDGEKKTKKKGKDDKKRGRYVSFYLHWILIVI